jgi:hypothetical protein
MFSKTSGLALGPTWRGSLLLVIWPGREVNHSPLSRAEVTDEWSYTFTAPIRVYGTDREIFVPEKYAYFRPQRRRRTPFFKNSVCPVRFMFSMHDYTQTNSVKLRREMHSLYNIKNVSAQQAKAANT